MHFKPIFFVTGLFLLILASMMFLPAYVDWHTNTPGWENFIWSALATGFVGGFMVLVNGGKVLNITVKEAFLLTTISWVSVTLFACLPLWFSDLNIRFVDAFFEAMSGISTTGATVLVGLDYISPGILLWRSILQWLGGIGIIVMALSIFPFMKVGGMQLFRTESSEKEKVLPQAAKLASSLGSIYVVLTFACMILYMMNGMNSFDAVNHAMTTMATGGFSTHDGSMAYFANRNIDYIATFFMIVAGLPFVLYLRAVRGDFKALFVDTQVRSFLAMVAIVIGLMTIYLYNNNHYETLVDSFSYASFNTVSVLTGTGFVTQDYMFWGDFGVGVMFFLAFMGGCVGSTTCAIKIFRFQVIYSVVVCQIKKLIHPHGIFVPQYNNRPIPKDVPLSVLSFVFVYGLCFIVATAALQLMGLDFITAASGAATTISNVGPGLGDIIGPAGNFSSLPDGAKWLMSFCMIVGRLELFTVLILFTPQFWRYS